MRKLIISTENKKQLTKNQEAFNKVTAQIEKLRKEIAKKQLQFDSAIELYRTSIHPLRLKKVEQQRKLFDLLWEVYKSKRLSKPDQRVLKQLLQQDIYELLNLAPDEALKVAFQELEGERYEHVLERHEMQMKEELKQAVEELDLDIDLDNVEDEAQLAEKLAQARQQMLDKEEQKQQRKKPQRKTARQLEKQNLQQAAEDLKQKNISTIYRQLAKLFHPDLEQDEDRKADKEMLMKQLTTAYQSKNLHELLLLELQWIHKETNHLESLTEEKLAVYLQVLREQAKELEQEKSKLFMHPRYHVLVEEFGLMAAMSPLRVLQQEEQGLEDEISALERNAAAFRSDPSMAAVKKMLKEVRAAMRETDDDDWGNMMVHMGRM